MRCLRRELEAERAREAALEEELARERQHEAELEDALARERQHEAELEAELEAERAKELELERQVTSMKLRIVDKHLEKAADEQEARRIIDAHEAEHAEHQVHLRKERKRRKTVSQARHKRRRYKHVLAALRTAIGEDKSEDEVAALLDTNDDGIVELQELWTIMQSLTMASGHPMTQDDAKRILREFDSSKDAVVTVQELLDGLQWQQQQEQEQSAASGIAGGSA